MRHMGWSYDQLMACPDDYLLVIAQEAEEAAREARWERDRIH